MPAALPQPTSPRRSLRRPVLIALTALIAATLFAGSAEARSGGSFGGKFRRSSGSSRGSSSFGSRRAATRPSSRSSTRYVPVPVPIGGRGYGYGYGGGSSGGSLFFLIFIVGGIVVVVFVVRKMRKGGGIGGIGGGDGDEKCDVALIQLGIQAQARALQDHMEELARNTDTSTEEGLAAALRELALDLSRHAVHLEYGAIQRQPKLTLDRAEQQFGMWAGDERAKFEREIIRADGMGVRTQQKELETDGLHDEDGDIAVHEFFVVSVVVAARGLVLPDQMMGSADVQAVLSALRGVSADQLVALEVVWSPAAVSDSMGRMEMETRYPELFQL